MDGGAWRATVHGIPRVRRHLRLSLLGLLGAPGSALSPGFIPVNKTTLLGRGVGINWENGINRCNTIHSRLTTKNYYVAQRTIFNIL